MDRKKTIQKAEPKALALQCNPEVDFAPEEKAFYAKILDSDSPIEELVRIAGTNKDLLSKMINRAINALAFEDRDLFIEKMSPLSNEEGRNNLWQYNHRIILAAISNLTRQHNRFPTRSEISAETCLSQQTINKHLKHYFGSDEYTKKKEELIVMRERVLAGMFTYAIHGDAKAAKVFLSATAPLTEPPAPKTQNNYIQINGIVITQEQLQLLPAGKLNQIQKILSITQKIKTDNE